MIAAILLFATVVLSWDWNPEEYLGGYKIHCGIESGKPTASLDVGKIATWNADNFLKSQPPGARLFFTVTAYNTEDKEGEPSNEVSYLKPAVPTPTPTPTPTPAPTPTPTPTVPPHTHTWSEITGKPATFPGNPHTHSLPDRTGN